MDRRDQELLDKQLRGIVHQQNEGKMALTIAMVFLVGMMLGGALVGHEDEQTKMASFDVNNALTASQQ